MFQTIQQGGPTDTPHPHAGLDTYLDTFRLTRGIHKKVDVSNDALEYVS